MQKESQLAFLGSRVTGFHFCRGLLLPGTGLLSFCRESHSPSSNANPVSRRFQILETGSLGKPSPHKSRGELERLRDRFHFTYVYLLKLSIFLKIARIGNSEKRENIFRLHKMDEPARKMKRNLAVFSWVNRRKLPSLAPP